MLMSYENEKKTNAIKLFHGEKEYEHRKVAKNLKRNGQ